VTEAVALPAIGTRREINCGCPVWCVTSMPGSVSNAITPLARIRHSGRDFARQLVFARRLVAIVPDMP
jgi:hypothetical protein